MLLSIFPLSVFADNTENEIVYEDLSSSTIKSDFERVFPIEFDIADYKENSNITDFQYIATMETFVDNRSQIYIYIYNPSRKIIYKESEDNTLSIAYYNDKVNVIDKNNYNKHHLSLIDVYEDTLDNSDYTNALIIKYQVENVSCEDPQYQRYYKLSDVELLEKEQTLPISFMIGKQLQFFLDKNGCTNISETDLSNLELKAHHTFYRIKTSSVDVYEDIQSVFFAIPNELLDIYGRKISMKLNYSVEDYNPILVVNNQKIADDFNSSDFISVDGSTDRENFKYSVLYNKMTWLPGDSLVDGWRNGFNIAALQDYRNKFSLTGGIISLCGQPYYLYSFDNIVELPLFPDVKAPIESTTSPLRLTLFYEYDLKPESTAIFGEDLLEKINKKSNDRFFKISTKDFKETLTFKSSGFDVTQYSLCSKWSNRLNIGKGDFNEAGEAIEFKPFQEIDLKDLKNLSREAFSNKYLIDKYDVACGGECESCFTCVTNKAEYKNHTWFILHYTKTNYEAYDSVVIDNSTGYYEACNSFVFKTQVIRDFDVIQVGLSDNENKPMELYTIFPIGRAPTDFVADVTTPSEKNKPDIDLDDTYKKINELIEKITRILMIVFALIIFVFILKIIDYLKPIFKRFRKENKK